MPDIQITPQLDTTPVATPSKASGRFFSIFLIAIVLVVGWILGLTLSRFYEFGLVSQIIESSQTRNIRPDLLKLLKNPILHTWKTSVEGVIVSKTGNSITLDREGSQLEVFIDSNTTISTPESRYPDYTFVPFDQVEIGKRIRGSARIARNGDQLKIIAEAMNLAGETDLYKPPNQPYEATGSVIYAP